MALSQDTAICETCKKSFGKRSGKDQPNRFCSYACAWARPVNEAYCEICKSAFPKRAGKEQTNRFCSRACYLIHHANETHFIRPCLSCGKDLRVRPSDEKHGAKYYCSMACRRQGKTPPARKCKQCHFLFTPIQIRRRGTKYWVVVVRERLICSKQCLKLFYRTNEARKEKISKAFQGSNHPNWTGGASQRQKAYRGPTWQRVAEKVRKRQKYRCAVCGKHQDDNGRKLDVNHKERYHNFTDHRKANRLSNLIALCHSCHMQHEQRENVQMSLPWGAGPQGTMQGIKHYAAYLARETVHQARIWHKEGLTRKVIAVRLNVPIATIYNLLAGKTYRDV